MGYQYKFKDGELYDVNDVNGIVSHFTSAGVSTYSDLNGISGALTETGVSNAYNSCKVVKDGEKLKIMPGEAFFSDGSVISVDSSGVSFDPLRYVYFKKDAVTETGYPVCSDTAPSGSDIPLAEYENGVLTDKRVYAKSKIQGYGRNVTQKITTDLNGTYKLTAAHPDWNDVKQIALTRTDFSRVMLACKGDFYDGQYKYYIRGGYWGTIGTNKKVTWSGGGRCTDFTQFVMQGDAVDSLHGYPEPFVYCNGSSYVQIDFDFSTNGFVTVRLKTNSVKNNFSLSNLELTLC